jgi:hypothetical protein
MSSQTKSTASDHPPEQQEDEEARQQLQDALLAALDGFELRITLRRPEQP